MDCTRRSESYFDEGEASRSTAQPFEWTSATEKGRKRKTKLDSRDGREWKPKKISYTHASDIVSTSSSRPSKRMVLKVEIRSAKDDLRCHFLFGVKESLRLPMISKMSGASDGPESNGNLLIRLLICGTRQAFSSRRVGAASSAQCRLHDRMQR